MTIDQFNFAGKKTFVRVDFNVPVDENFNITDDTRIVAAMPTLSSSDLCSLNGCIWHTNALLATV